MHPGHFLLLVIQPGDPAGLGGGDFDHGLVGHDIDHRLVFLDLVAFGHTPFHHLALDDAFADVGQDEVFGGFFAGRRCRGG